MSSPTPYTSSKTYDNLPCCHRAWRHAGHCRLIHGYSRSYTFHFACSALSPEGFVVDYGALGELKAWLEEMFDHTTLIAADDPDLPLFTQLHERGIIDMRVMEGTSMEAGARIVWEKADALIRAQSDGRAWCTRVEARENDKNGATYTAPEETR